MEPIDQPADIVGAVGIVGYAQVLSKHLEGMTGLRLCQRMDRFSRKLLRPGDPGNQQQAGQETRCERPARGLPCDLNGVLDRVLHSS
jgi:hypothetical protein